MKQKLEIGESNNQIAVCDLPANRIEYITWSATGYYLLNGRFDHWGEQSWIVQPKSGTALSFNLQGNDGNSPTENMGKNLQLALYVANQDSLVILDPLSLGRSSFVSDFVGDNSNQLVAGMSATLLSSQQAGDVSFNGDQFLLQHYINDWIYNNNPDSDTGWATGRQIEASTEMIYGPFNFTA